VEFHIKKILDGPTSTLIAIQELSVTVQAVSPNFPLTRADGEPEKEANIGLNFEISGFGVRAAKDCVIINRKIEQSSFFIIEASIES
jgi:hypothetical protein